MKREAACTVFRRVSEDTAGPIGGKKVGSVVMTQPELQASMGSGNLLIVLIYFLF